MNINGIINVNKQKGYTSHDVVAVIRRITKSKTGHTGTLDPDAEGVLPICLGGATKLSEYLAADDKKYTAEVLLGIVTDTGDISGNIIEKRDVTLTLEQIQEVAASFLYKNIGIYMQTPPMYSAIKIGGKKLYELARRGIEIERPPRQVMIHDIRIHSLGESSFTMDVSCSKGTYIRSLCMDLGEKLGCGAVMGNLTRTASGLFDIKTAVKLKTLRQATDLSEYILAPEEVLPHPMFHIRQEGMKRALNGNQIPSSYVINAENAPENGMFWLKYENQTVGLYKKVNNEFLPKAIIINKV